MFWYNYSYNNEHWKPAKCPIGGKFKYIIVDSDVAIENLFLIYNKKYDLYKCSDTIIFYPKKQIN